MEFKSSCEIRKGIGRVIKISMSMNFPIHQGLGRRNTYMRWLINYIRSCFCKHDWECLQSELPVYLDGCQRPVGYEWVYRCKKCGCKNIIKN